MKADLRGKIELGVLSGWGIPPASLSPYFPAGTLILPPTRDNALRLAAEAKSVVGYSLGAWLLLELASKAEISAENVRLYAPFLAFPKEAELGGKISATQVKFLRRWIKKDPVPALADFYRRAGLASFPVPQTLPYRAEELDLGLVYLIDGYISAVPDDAKNWEIVVGACDALLDAHAVEKIFLQSKTRLVPAGTHDLATLVEGEGTVSFF